MRSCFFFFLFLLSIGCVQGIVSRSNDVSSYAARASWQWESTDHFLVRGRARLEGRNQVFSGPLLVWASRSVPAVRADFCGPDGSPLISLLVDSSGCLIYYPEDASAFFFAGGMPAGSGLLDAYALISLIRTGFPAVPVQWEMVASSDTSSLEVNQWYFLSRAGSDTAVVSLKHSDIFPLFDAGDFSLEVTASSWHDEFNAWPMEWRLRSSSVNAVARIRSYDVQREPQSSVWNMVVPVPVDTVRTDGGFWQSCFALPIR